MCDDFDEQEIRSIPSTISLTSDLDDDNDTVDAPTEVQISHHVAEIQQPSSFVPDTSAEDAVSGIGVLYTHHVSNPQPLAPFTVISDTRIVPETDAQEIDVVICSLFIFSSLKI